MSNKPDLLLIGHLFGSAIDSLREVFELTVIDDFTQLPLQGTDMRSLRTVAIGMVGSGHISTQAVNAEFFDLFPQLELLAALGVGCEYIDVETAHARNVVVTNTPGTNTEETADTALGLLLCAVRQIPQADRHIRTGQWPNGMFPLTGTLRNRKLGILGLGNIGKAIARRAQAFGLEILYHGRRRQAVPYEYVTSVHALATQADILMIVVPGGDETQHMVDAEVIRALGPEGILVNIARGSVVDEAALIDALTHRHIKTAAIDAFRDEPTVPAALLDMAHVVLTPHIGSGTHHTREQMSLAVVNNLVQWLRDKSVITPMT